MSAYRWAVRQSSPEAELLASAAQSSVANAVVNDLPAPAALHALVEQAARDADGKPEYCGQQT